MKLVGIITEDFVNYKKPSMVLEFPFCSFKCDKECGEPVCQNSILASAPIIDVNVDELIEDYLDNPITEAIVLQGLEPLDSLGDVFDFLYELRLKYHCNDDVVIYTGYKENEQQAKKIQDLVYLNLFIKYGRFVPNQNSHYDEMLGVNLASDNQYTTLQIVGNRVPIFLDKDDTFQVENRINYFRSNYGNNGKIWVYTDMDFGEVWDHWIDMIYFADMIVDKDNQIIDLQQTIKTGSIIKWKKM